MGRIIIKICKFWACQHDFKTACFHFVFISGIWLWCALLNIIFSYWMHWLTLWSLNGTKCTQAWSFLQNSQWYKVTGLPIFLLVLWSHLDTKFSLCSKCFVFWLAVFFPPNRTGPFCTHISSICPSTDDRKMDWKCFQCSELVCQDHFNKKIQIACDSCKEQS